MTRQEHIMNEEGRARTPWERNTMDWKSKYAVYPDCRFRTGRYVNGNIALQVESLAEGLVCTCSVNPGVPLPDNELAVKDWSENEGIVEELKRQNVISGDPVRTIDMVYGFVKIKVFALTDYGKSLFKKESPV